MTPRPEPLLNEDVHGWFRWQEQFDELLREIKPKRCVEVGTWLGCSALYTAERIKAWDGILVCVDTWKPGWYSEDPTVRAKAPTAYEQFCSNVWHRGLQATILPIRGTSIQVELADLDWVYIDGGHEENDVREDLEYLYPRVRSGGIILGDDFGMKGVQDAWSKYAEKKELVITVDDQLVYTRV